MDEFPAEPETPLRVRLIETRRALARWQKRIAAQCPGEHRYVQHRKGELPSCGACGYCDVGLHVSELGASWREHDLPEDDVDDAYTGAEAQ